MALLRVPRKDRVWVARVFINILNPTRSKRPYSCFRVQSMLDEVIAAFGVGEVPVGDSTPRAGLSWVIILGVVLHNQRLPSSPICLSFSFGRPAPASSDDHSQIAAFAAVCRSRTKFRIETVLTELTDWRVDGATFEGMVVASLRDRIDSVWKRNSHNLPRGIPQDTALLAADDGRRGATGASSSGPPLRSRRLDTSWPSTMELGGIRWPKTRMNECACVCVYRRSICITLWRHPAAPPPKTTQTFFFPHCRKWRLAVEPRYLIADSYYTNCFSSSYEMLSSLFAFPLTAAPDEPAQRAMNLHDQSIALLIFFPVLTTITVGVRIFVRTRLCKGAFGWDDVLLLVTTVSTPSCVQIFLKDSLVG